MRAGEGLVGLIARERSPSRCLTRNPPRLLLSPRDGRGNLPFLPRVPVLRGGAVLGVLVVQNRAARTYAEEESRLCRLSR